MIEGILLHHLKHIIVPKGDIYHAIKSTDDGFVGFGEAYFSQIEHNQIKGWKRHNRITLNLIVPIGTIKFVFYDDREGSATKGEFTEIILSPEINYQRITVPPRIWMAFYGVGLGISMLMDIIPEPHDPSEVSKMSLDEIAYKF